MNYSRRTAKRGKKRSELLCRSSPWQSLAPREKAVYIRWNARRQTLPPSSCVCTLLVYCSLLKTGPTAGKPLAKFRAKQVILLQDHFTEHINRNNGKNKENQRRGISALPLLEPMLLSSEVMPCPQQREGILLLLSKIPV